MLSHIAGRRRSFVTLIVALSALCCGGALWADVVSYQLSGIASGSVGTTTFTNAPFTFTGQGDPMGVFDVVPGVVANPLFTGSFIISGIGTAEALNPFYFFVNQNAPPGAGFIDIFSGDVLDFAAPAFGAYGGTTPLGPLSVDLTFLAPFDTTSGTLSIASAEDLVFTAAVQTTVPEPSLVAPVIAAAGLLIVYRRRRQARKSSAS